MFLGGSLGLNIPWIEIADHVQRRSHMFSRHLRMLICVCIYIIFHRPSTGLSLDKTPALNEWPSGPIFFSAGLGQMIGHGPYNPYWAHMEPDRFRPSHFSNKKCSNYWRQKVKVRVHMNIWHSDLYFLGGHSSYVVVILWSTAIIISELLINGHPIRI